MNQIFLFLALLTLLPSGNLFAESRFTSESLVGRYQVIKTGKNGNCDYLSFDSIPANIEVAIRYNKLLIFELGPQFQPSLFEGPTQEMSRDGYV